MNKLPSRRLKINGDPALHHKTRMGWDLGIEERPKGNVERSCGTHFKTATFAENGTSVWNRILIGAPQLRLEVDRFPLCLSQLIPRLGQLLFQGFDAILAVGGCVDATDAVG